MNSIWLHFENKKDDKLQKTKKKKNQKSKFLEWFTNLSKIKLNKLYKKNVNSTYIFDDLVWGVVNLAGNLFKFDINCLFSDYSLKNINVFLKYKHIFVSKLSLQQKQWSTTLDGCQLI